MMAHPDMRQRKSSEQQDRERLARIETRVTTLCLAMGVEVPCAKPIFARAPRSGEGILDAPSVNSSMRDILGAIPEGFTGPIDLLIRGETIGRIVLADRS